MTYLSLCLLTPLPVCSAQVCCVSSPLTPCVVWHAACAYQVFTLLEDNQVALQTMMGSRFISGVQAAVEVGNG